MSSGSVSGNIAMRSWLRPILRYGSASTVPLARVAFATAGASIAASRSIVPTTWLWSSGLPMKGIASVERSAQP